MPKKSLAVPLSIVTVGIGWLLNVSDVLQAVDWIWTLLLATAGLLAVLVGGWDKVTFVVAPLLLTASGLSVFRQLGRLPLERELPCLVILLGLLWTVAESLRLPAPGWMAEPQA
ncbi:MAG TPA: hypothetical protein VM509_16290 [Planctomycetota bacterium]|nr:hypothetical protein [Planctomycetota bacterium]